MPAEPKAANVWRQADPAQVAGVQGLPSSARLLKPAEFRRVFEQGQVRHSRCFSLRFAPAAHGMSTARLGLAVSRKACPLAVQRNRVKRAVRESFRQHRAELPAMDIVVMAKPSARDALNLKQLADQLWSSLNQGAAQKKD